MNSPVRGGETVELCFRANPGDLAWLDVGVVPGRVVWPFTTGIWQLDFPSYLGTFSYGSVPPTGELVVQIPVHPPMNAGQLFLQADYMDPATTKLTLGGASTLLILP